MEIKDLVRVFNEVLNQEKKETINEETNFKESDSWSSLTAFELTVKIEEEFGVKLRGIQIRRCKTIRDLFNLINRA